MSMHSSNDSSKNGLTRVLILPRPPQPDHPVVLDPLLRLILQ